MRKPFTYLLGAAALALAATACSTPAKNDTTEITEVKMTKERLLDKIKGGWAGQAIGCTYGGWSLWWKSDFGLWGAAGSSAGSSRAESAAQLLVKRAKKVNIRRSDSLEK